MGQPPARESRGAPDHGSRRDRRACVSQRARQCLIACDMPDREKGKLRILLGYAAGVGKTYRMLEESQEAKRAGRDVVVGYFEPHGRKDTIAQTEGLEIVPRRKIDYRGREFEEMDTDAILLRK